MRLNVTNAQYEQIARERFLDSVFKVLVESYPESRADLYSRQTRETFRLLYAKAHTYGFRAELELMRYLIAAWQLGADFDTRYPAMAEILALQNVGSAQKAKAIEQVAKTLINTLKNGAKA